MKKNFAMRKEKAHDKEWVCRASKKAHDKQWIYRVFFLFCTHSKKRMAKKLFAARSIKCARQTLGRTTM
jgi:hypothetical protein